MASEEKQPIQASPGSLPATFPPGEESATPLSCHTIRADYSSGESLHEYLSRRFAKVPREVWAHRIRAGKVLDQAGHPLGADTICAPLLRIFYRREVELEPRVPFTEEILFQNEHILVACKPHFLAVIPSGPYVRECLVHRLRLRTGNPDLTPVNRLDRETAGLVLFSVRPDTRRLYHRLFQRRKVHKVYEAVGPVPADSTRSEWDVSTRIEQGEPWFRRKITGGEPNAQTRIRLCEARGSLGLFRLEPLTGQTHQLRLHLCLIGSRILNDPLYPDLWPEPKPGFENPLQLLARELAFQDPVTREELRFTSSRRLESWPAHP